MSGLNSNKDSCTGKSGISGSVIHLVVSGYAGHRQFFRIYCDIVTDIGDSAGNSISGRYGLSSDGLKGYAVGECLYTSVTCEEYIVSGQYCCRIR